MNRRIETALRKYNFRKRYPEGNERVVCSGLLQLHIKKYAITYIFSIWAVYVLCFFAFWCMNFLLYWKHKSACTFFQVCTKKKAMQIMHLHKTKKRTAKEKKARNNSCKRKKIHNSTKRVIIKTTNRNVNAYFCKTCMFFMGYSKYQ